MNFFLRTAVFIIFSGFFSAFSFAQVNVSLAVSPQKIGKDGYATLKIVVENTDNIQQIKPPSLENFMIMSGPNQETGVVSVNGQVSRYVSMSFVIKPKKTGRFNIDAAEVKIAGKLYKTNASSIVVDNSTGSGNGLPGYNLAPPDPFVDNRNQFDDYIFRKNDNVADKVNRNMILRLEVDKTSCYVGEPVVATYKLYTRLKSESKLAENPSFNGFSVVDLTQPDATEYTREKLNGREYNVYTIRKAQLYPLQPGDIELESAELENNIQFIKEEFANKRNAPTDLFDAFDASVIPPDAVINQKVNLKSKPVTISVKPLPEKNKPASFAGAVGKFDMEAALQKSSFPANEPGKLVVKISGSGNLQLVTAPVLSWPQGTDAFDPVFSEDINKATVPVSGSKTFEYNFSVDKEGNYSLPPVEFSYFDPAGGVYKTILSKELNFTVTTATAPAQDPALQSAGSQPVTGINKIFHNRWWIIVFLAFVAVSGITIWLLKEKKNLDAQKNKIPEVENDARLNEIVETAVVNQRNPLEKTETCLYQDDCNNFYSLLNNELKEFLAHKFAVSPHDITTGNIATLMDKKNISNDTALQMQQLLEQVEWRLYTPFERNDQMHSMYQQAQDIIQLINTYHIRHL